jgi:hypothetical protein
MATLERVIAGTVSRKSFLLCVLFIALNILDARLTGIALGAGGYELNPILGARFGSSILAKGLISAGIAAALILLKQGKLLKPVNIAMAVICTWNGVAILSWL